MSEEVPAGPPPAVLFQFLENLPLTIREATKSSVAFGLSFDAVADGAEPEDVLKRHLKPSDLGYYVAADAYTCASTAAVLELVLMHGASPELQALKETMKNNVDTPFSQKLAAQAPLEQAHSREALTTFQEMRETVLSPAALYTWQKTLPMV